MVMMATASYQGPGWKIEFRQDFTEITSMYGPPDPRWRYTDQAGHEHRAVPRGDDDADYPTLVIREGPAYWCEDCRDEHTDSWQACAECGERITPGTLPGVYRKMIPGLCSIELTEEFTGDEAVAVTRADSGPDVVDVVISQSAGGFRAVRRRIITPEQAQALIRERGRQ